MMANLRQVMGKVDAMSLRERLMIFAAILALFFGLVFTVVMEPMAVKQKLLLQKLKDDQKTIAAHGDEITAKLRANTDDPDALLKVRHGEVSKQIALVQNELREQQKGLVPANKIAPLLQNLLKKHSNVHVFALRTLPVVVVDPLGSNGDVAVASASASASANASGTPLEAEKQIKESLLKTPTDTSSPAAKISNAVEGVSNKGTDSSANSSANSSVTPPATLTNNGARIYRHEVEIELQGTYLELLSVLQEMEKLPWQLYWSKASLRTDEHPQSTLSLRVFTLSLDKTWLDL